MQVQAAITPQVSLIANRPADLGKEDRLAQVQEELAAPIPGKERREVDETVAVADKVSLSAEARVEEAPDQPAPVYAEVWKGPIKIAQIDVHGHVTSYSGLVPTSEGGGLAGAFLAAQRAVQVAQQVGGEIRAAGQSLDSQTLLMRARLARTYSV